MAYDGAKYHKPKFRLTVPDDLYQETCDATEPAFAESYLFGATLGGAYLTPRTLTAYEKMKGRWDFVQLLKRLKLTLIKPEPWPGKGDRASSEDPY